MYVYHTKIYLISKLIFIDNIYLEKDYQCHKKLLI